MISTYWANQGLKFLYSSNNSTTFYVGISSTVPTADGGNVTEPSGGNYARVKIDGLSEPSGGVITNTTAIEFPVSTSEWFPASARAICYVIFDGAGGDAHVLGSGNFYAPVAVTENTKFLIAAGRLSIRLTDETGDA